MVREKGYTLSDFSEGQAQTSSHRAANEQGEQQYEESKRKKSQLLING